MATDSRLWVAASAAAALAAAPALGATMPPGHWVSFCTAEGASLRLVPDDGSLPNQDGTTACHAPCMLPRKQARSGPQ